MKLSLNWIKQYTDVSLPVDELVKKIGAQLGEVEGVENLGPKYQGAIIVKVVSCQKHPNADRLNVCVIDDGAITPDVKRDENGHVQVVCGAPNVHADMLAVWLPPGATVPDSFDKEPFVLEARELRGVVSNGMLASPKELALGDSHDGILEIDASEWSPNQKDIQPGASFAKVFGLDDVVIDIENKMFTHRPDLFGELGLAREVAGITGARFVSPDWYGAAAEFPGGSGRQLSVVNEVPELVPRFMALAIKDVKVKPSPLWLQCELVRVGQKPVNNIVDVTNYIMLLTAQPTHAYDYDKVRGGQLVARLAKPGEKITLLNHKEYQLDPADIVIADNEGAVGLAGVMGGGDSEVSDTTTNIVLECASFDMYAVRRSSMRHGVFTDALTRFNKGQSPLQNPHVLHLLMQSVFDVAGGEVASPVVDESTFADRQWVHPPVPVTAGFINDRLGLKLGAEQMQTLLENVEFKVDVEGDKLTVTAPFWRTDIESREDVVEEVGRLYGYDQLPLELPQRSVKPVGKDGLLQTKARIRDILSRAGANEVLTYSFVHGSLLANVGQDPNLSYKLSNALSPDLQYYRQTLLPSLMSLVHPNIKAGYDEFALFEIGKGHVLPHADDPAHQAEGPFESDRLALVFAATDKKTKGHNGAAYYRARRYLDLLLEELGLSQKVRMEPYNPETYIGTTKVKTVQYEPSRTARIGLGDMALGEIGEFRPEVGRALKLPPHAAGFELDLSLLAARSTAKHDYQPLPRFPKVMQDITLRVTTETPFGTVYEALRTTLKAQQPAQTRAQLRPVSMYQNDTDTSHTHLTFRLSIASYEKTLTDKAVSDLLDLVLAELAATVQFERV